MTDDRRETFRRLLDEVRVELGAVRRDVEQLHVQLRDLEEQERLLAKLSQDDPRSGVPPQTSAAEVPRSFSAEVRVVARRAIREAGRPLDRAAILQAVVAAGLRLPGTDAAKRVGKILSMDHGLANLKGEGYVIRGEEAGANESL